MLFQTPAPGRRFRRFSKYFQHARQPPTCPDVSIVIIIVNTDLHNSSRPPTDIFRWFLEPKIKFEKFAPTSPSSFHSFRIAYKMAPKWCTNYVKNSTFFNFSLNRCKLCQTMFRIENYILWSFSNRSVKLCPILEPIHFWPFFIDKIPSTAKPKRIWLISDSSEKVKKNRFFQIFFRWV